MARLRVFLGNVAAAGGSTINCGVATATWTTFAATVTASDILNCGVAVATWTTFAATLTTGTIALTDPTDGLIIQRVASVGSLAVAGTYTGAPAGVQYRIVLDGTSTEVVTWTTISGATIGGGTWSGTITSIPQGGWYNVQVRFLDDTNVTDSSASKVGVGAWYAYTISQSLGARPFNTGGSTNGLSTVRCISSVEATSTISPKETLAALPSGTLGAAKFANTLATALGIPIGLVDGSVGSTSVTQWDGSPAGTFLASTIDAVDLIGGKLEGVLIDIGQTDAAGGTTESAYASALYNAADSAIKVLRAGVTNASGLANLPVYLSILGRSNMAGTTDARAEAIRTAQTSLIGTADIYFGAQVADIDLSDDVHPTAAGFEKIAERLAQSVLYVLGEVAYPGKGPSITSAAFADETLEVIDVKIAHLGGSDFTPTSGINGFEVLDDGTPVTVSTRVRQTPTKIRLTLAAPIAGTATVRYLYGQDGGVTFASTYTSEVVDNTSLALPLNWEDTITVGPFVPQNNRRGAMFSFIGGKVKDTGWPFVA